MTSGPRREAQDGVISVLLALSMALFVVLLAAVIDLGQIQGAKTALASATSSAAQRAATVLAQGGCEEIDTARAAATTALTENASTATITTFEVAYGLVTVTAPADCILAAALDQHVGQVRIVTSDERTAIFSAAFTDKGLSTNATTTAEWGYVTAMAGGVRPLSLCADHPAYLDYRTYVAQLELHEAAPLVNPSPSPTLIDTFDIEIDAFQGTVADNPEPGVPETGFCEDNSTPPVARRYGDLVNLDPSGSQRDTSSAYFGSPAVGLRTRIAGWLEDGAPWTLTLDDPMTGANEAYCGEGENDQGACEGVASANSTNVVGPLLPLIDSVFTIALHDTPQCHKGQDYGHCDGAGTDRRHRAYPLTGFVRVELLCARITAYPTILAASAVADPDPLSPTFGSDCAGLQKAAFMDGNPGDDVFVRLRFVVDSVIGEGHLSATPLSDDNFLGVSVCAVDGYDNCRF